MKVRAKFDTETDFGWDNKTCRKIHNGNVFDIDSEKEFSETWMELVEMPESADKRRSRPKKVLDEHSNLQ